MVSKSDQYYKDGKEKEVGNMMRQEGKLGMRPAGLSI